MARKSLRRLQAITPFGVGAIVDFPGQSLMAAGLDMWPDKPACTVYDDRLAHRLGIQYFRSPPPGPDNSKGGNYLPFVRFPLWHFCPRCRALSKTVWNETSPPRCSSSLGSRFQPKPGQKSFLPCSELPEKRRWRMVPVRFIVACDAGHIDDFPWIEWVHTRPGQLLNEANICASPALRLNYTGKAGLLGLLVSCENCDVKARSMMGSAGPDSLQGLHCSGNRPWLGPRGKQDCSSSSSPRMLQRGATNLYFSKLASSILIPPFSDPIRKVVDDPHSWQKLTNGVQGDDVVDEQRLKIIAEWKNLDFEQLKDAVIQKLKGICIQPRAQSEEEFRYSEYQALLNGSEDTEGEFVTVFPDMEDYDTRFLKYIDKIVLVEKLAETRALTGFSRINPPQYREFEQQDQLQLSLQSQNWLPAIRVYGEGIFITLNKSCIEQWSSVEVANHYNKIIETHQKIYHRLGRQPRNLPPKFFLLHTLAHLLIRRLSFECGYGSSSLRERIYCWDEKGKEMMGILIYTAAGDSEGTMGGLVLQAKPGRFESLLFGTISDALWCSSDPLCIESHGQGIDSLNRAACHACALLPETSCEEGNRFLDRASVIGLPHNPNIGYLTEISKKILSGTI